MRTKRIMSIVLTLVMLLGTFPGMSLTASAAGNTTEITPTNTSGTMTITLTIKAAPTVTAPTAKTLTYNGQKQELVNAGSTEDGTLYYAVTTENKAPTDESLYTTSIPTGTDVGTYYVWYKAIGDESHSDSDAEVVTVTIKEKTEAHTHKIQHVEAKEPTCTEDGYEAHYECTECDKWFKDLGGHYQLDETEKAEMTKKATGHKWDDGVITEAATYYETGTKTYTCSVCGETKAETIPVKTGRSSSSSDSSDSDSDSSGGGSSGKSGSISTKSIDVNGNVFGGPSAGFRYAFK